MPEAKKKSVTSKATASNKKSMLKKSNTKVTSTKKKTGSSKKNIIKKTDKSDLSSKSKKSKEIVVDVIEDDLDFEVNDKSTLSDFLETSLADSKSRKNELRGVNNDDEEVVEISQSKSVILGPTIVNRDDLDNQKNFFNELRLEVEQKEQKKKKFKAEDQDVQDLLELFEDDDELAEDKLAKKNRSISLYSRFVWKFVLIVLLLIGFVFYFSFTKLVIDVVPRNENLNESLLLKVEENSSGIKLLSDPRENVSGRIKEIHLSSSKEIPASGEEYVGEDLTGRVKIINNYNRSQVLVATTRLLSPDNKLFRIKEAVNVPAGSEAWVDIYTDKPNNEFAIKPSTFSIPGLWVGLQDEIYAKSEEAFVFEQKKQKYVRASDISLAEKEIDNDFLSLLEKEIEQEKTQLEAEMGIELEHVYLQNGSNDITVEAEVDEKIDSFIAKGDASFVVVFFSKEEGAKYADSRLNLLLPSGKELLNFDPENIIYNLESFDLEEGSATIKSSFSGKMMLKAEGEVIRKESLVNLSIEQLNTYLKDQSEIKSFELKFRPSFIKKAPRLVDRIKINLVDDK